MKKPKLLDLFCGGGGSAKGYQRAGFYVVGVDNRPQPRYVGDEFMQGDALTFSIEGFDFIHASPPCQAYTTMSNRWGSDSQELIDDIRARLNAACVPWVIENVTGARRAMRSPLLLTGEMFGLRVYRPRLFESSVLLFSPHARPRQESPVAIYGKMDGRRLWTRKNGSELRAPDNLEVAARAMDIDWMNWDELKEAIPPAYTEYIGRQMLAAVRGRDG